MLKSCVKTVEWLCKAVGQTGGFYTASTTKGNSSHFQNHLYSAKNTGSAQFYCALPQTVLSIFNLLRVNLYPLSPLSMITTNLIKE
jgi:hypothetical protein